MVISLSRVAMVAFDVPLSLLFDQAGLSNALPARWGWSPQATSDRCLNLYGCRALENGLTSSSPTEIALKSAALPLF
jgi:hypothetical protein